MFVGVNGPYSNAQSVTEIVDIFLTVFRMEFDQQIAAKANHYTQLHKVLKVSYSLKDQG
jgi:hypothetical protein